MHQSNAAICEIRPQFSLPVNGIEQLTIVRGTSLHKSLTRSLNDAAAARNSLPEMQISFGRLQSDLAQAQRALNSNDSTPATTGAMRNNATIAIAQLNRAIKQLSKDIGRAEGLIADEPAIKIELQDLDQIATYAQSIASVATVYVRFYSGDVTIPATVK
jgi:hypothetical protein